MKSASIVTIALRNPQDVVVARQRVRQVADHLGFSEIEQTRIATAASEIARNAFRYAQGGRLSLDVEGMVGHQRLVITVADDGPGIPHLSDVMAGDYRSSTGMGQGIVGARRLMDSFEIDTTDSGTTVVMRMPLASHNYIDSRRIAQIATELTRPIDQADEFHHQNMELRKTLDALTIKNTELERLSRELEDTNRGVVALHAELEDRAEQLRRVNQLQTQFMSYMSHEFRTPLDSQIALANILLSEADGPLTEEQRKQVNLLQRSARDLLAIVDDLLDNARVEAGAIKVRPSSFLLSDLFSALRATMRPLVNENVDLEFYEDRKVPSLFTDEVRLSQILRNLIANALKFTESGKVEVHATALPDDVVQIAITDTGIGIDEVSLHAIFEDYRQVEMPLQRKRKGTGLGLPLSRKLAELLGGQLTASSVPGTGSTFTVRIPAVYPIHANDEQTAAG